MEVIWLIIQATKVSLLCHWLRKDLKYLLLSKKAFVIIFNIIRIQYYTISGLSNLNHLWQKKKKNCLLILHATQQMSYLPSSINSEYISEAISSFLY